MAYYGSWKLDDLLTFVANTHSASTGSAVDADAVPSYHVYEDETASPIITGTMALLNGANTVGFYSEQIALSSANGFEKGKSYNVYIQAVVGGVTGTMAHNFQLEAEVDANTVSVPVTAGNVTGSVLGNVNGSVGSVSGNVGGNVVGSVGSVVAPVTAGNVTGSVLGNVNGSVASVTNPVTVGTNNDKTGYSLASPQSVNIIGNISGTITNVLNVVNPVTAGNVTGSVLGNVNGSVGSVTNPVTVGTNNDKTGYSLSTPQNFDLIGNISGTLSNVNTVINPVTAGNVTGSVLGNVNGSVNSVVQPVGISTGSFIGAIADGVWDEQIGGHLQAGSTGNALNSAGSAGDPWGTALPGAYVPGQAGHILASRMPTGTVVVSSNQDKTDYFLGTPQNFNMIGNITGSVSGSVGSVTTMGSTLLNKIADHVLRRTFANARASSDGDAVSFRSLLGAIAKLVNKWSISGATLTVYAEDDATSLGTQSLTGTAGADPITQIDTD